jgi:quercetin dioxygenase-like cupin family protein
MIVTTLKNAPKVPSGLDACKMYTSSNLEVIHLHLNPGEEVAVHSNPVDAVFCVVQGTVSMKADGSMFNLNLFDVIEVPAGIQRGLINQSKDDVRVLVVKKLI